MCVEAPNYSVLPSRYLRLTPRNSLYFPPFSFSALACSWPLSLHHARQAGEPVHKPAHACNTCNEFKELNCTDLQSTLSLISLLFPESLWCRFEYQHLIKNIYWIQSTCSLEMGGGYMTSGRGMKEETGCFKDSNDFNVREIKMKK